MRTVHLDFGNFGFSELYFAYIPFGNCYLDIGNLDFGDLGFSELYFAYIHFGNCNLDIGNFYFYIQSKWKLEIRDWEFVLCSPIGYSNLEFWTLVLRVQSL